MKNREILLVDDDLPFRTTLKKVLMTQNYNVRECESGIEACTILKENKFDLVISDIEMPDFSGIELLLWIKKNNTTPVVLITGFSNMLDITSAYQLGASGFLLKPFKKESIFEELNNIFGVSVSKSAFPTKTIATAPSEADDFCKVLIEDFVTGSKIEFNIYIKLNETKFIKIAHAGEDISLNQIKSYQEKGLKYLYIPKQDYYKLIGLNIKISKALAKKDVDLNKKLNFFKYTGETIVQQLFISGIDENAFALSKDFVQSSLEVISDDSTALLMLELLNSHADYIYAHSLGVSIYSVMIAKKLNWHSPQATFIISVAGLYHDIGKKEIPREILEKPRNLMTADERKIYESHAMRGKELMKLVESFPQSVADVAAQHHENRLGTGFPMRHKKSAIHPLAALIATANKFCELAIKSPHSHGMSAKDALNVMETEYPGEFEKEYMDALKVLIYSKN